MGPDWLNADAVELQLTGLDANAEIFLNGSHIDSHRNTFRPFVLDVRRRLRPGENVLLVRITGTDDDEMVSEADTDSTDGVRATTEASRGRPERGDPRRTFVRKHQYTFGWGWSPRVAATAIAGDTKVRAIRTACIRDAVALASPS